MNKHEPYQIKFPIYINEAMIAACRGLPRAQNWLVGRAVRNACEFYNLGAISAVELDCMHETWLVRFRDFRRMTIYAPLKIRQSTVNVYWNGLWWYRGRYNVDAVVYWR